MKKKHLQDIRGCFAHAGPQRIGRGIAEGALLVAQHDLAFEIQDFLADPLVLVVFIAQGDDHRALNALQVVQPVADLEFQRKQVGQVDRRVDERESRCGRAGGARGLPMRGGAWSGRCGRTCTSGGTWRIPAAGPRRGPRGWPASCSAMNASAGAGRSAGQSPR